MTDSSKIGTSDTIDKTLFCSFCGRTQHEVRRLVAGATVFICDECVGMCVELLKDPTQSFSVPIAAPVPRPMRPADDSRSSSLFERLVSKRTTPTSSAANGGPAAHGRGPSD